MGFIKRIQIVIFLPLISGCLFLTVTPSMDPVAVTLTHPKDSTAAIVPALQRSPAVSLTPTSLPSDVVNRQTSTPSLDPLPKSISDPFQIELPLAELTYLLPLTARHITEHDAALFFELSQPADGILFYRPIADGGAGLKIVPQRRSAPGSTTIIAIRKIYAREAF